MGSRSQRGSYSGFGLSVLGIPGGGAAGKGNLPDESTGEPEASDQMMGTMFWEEGHPGKPGPYLKVRWGLFHFLPVRA